MTEHFIIVGAQRCGTTGVYRLLEQHPDICLARPVRPEPKFFLDPEAADMGYREYLRRHFAHHRNETMLGEKSTSYIERQDAIPRIRHILPGCRLIFVLRDPVMRAYSNWRFSRMHGLETLDFEAALEAETQRLHANGCNSASVNPFAYASRGHYVRYLDLWAKHFDPERFIIVVSEDVFADPGSIRGVYGRLGLDTDCTLKDIGRVNASEEDPTPPPKAARERLREEFTDSIHELGARWNVNVSGWL